VRYQVHCVCACKKVRSMDVCNKSQRPLSWRLGLLCDFCCGVVSWSLLLENTRLLSTTPISNVFVTVCAFLSFSILGWCPVRRFIDAHIGTIRCLSLVGLMSFYFATSTVESQRHRILLSLSLVFDQSSLYVAFFDRPERRERSVAGYLLAFVTIAFFRWRHLSELRMWTSTFANVCTLLCGLFGAAWLGIERASSVSILEQQLVVRPTEGWFVPSASLGSSLFLLQLFTSDLDSLRKLFAVTRLDAAVFSCLIMIAALVGLCIANAVAKSKLWYLCATASLGVMWYTRDNANTVIAMRMACVVVAFVASLIAALVAEVAFTRLIGRSCLVMMTVYVMATLIAQHYSVQASVAFAWLPLTLLSLLTTWRDPHKAARGSAAVSAVPTGPQRVVSAFSRNETRLALAALVMVSCVGDGSVCARNICVYSLLCQPFTTGL
jgi:hypothetical protein